MLPFGRPILRENPVSKKPDVYYDMFTSWVTRVGGHKMVSNALKAQRSSWEKKDNGSVLKVTMDTPTKKAKKANHSVGYLYNAAFVRAFLQKIKEKVAEKIDVNPLIKAVEENVALAEKKKE